jgi:hypothetical protein
MISATAPTGLTIDTRKEEGVQVHYGNREGNLAAAETARSVWLIWFIRLVWFNQINKTNQTNQLNETDRTDRMNKTGWRTFSASC